MKQNTYTKEGIKARMFKRATTLWEIRNVDMLDPLVKLLIEALASEIFKLSGYMDDVEDRIVEKLAASFTPVHMTTAAPAHAIVHARAVEGKFDITPGIEFVYKDPYFIQKHNLRKLSFTSTGIVPVINGDVAAMISQGKYYEVTPGGGREHTANSIQKTPHLIKTAWIGLELSKEVESLQDVCFYFQFPLVENCDAYLRLIKHCRWYLGETQVNVTPGYNTASSGASVFELFDQRQYLNHETESKYKDHFVTITDSVTTNTLKRNAVPEELASSFDETTIKDLRNDLVWLKVVFSPAFDDAALSHLVVHMNCFPVSNVYRKQSVITATKFSSVLPIEKEHNEYFLFMDSVSDSRNNDYKQVQNHDDNIAGTYMIRHGGSERFSSLDARDFLEKLLDLYRDETIAFSSIDQDISSTARGLMEDLSEFETNLKSLNDDSEHASYLILSSDISRRTTLTMQYSLTNGAIANGIRSQEMLEVQGVADLNPLSTMLMTPTRGGRKSPPESSRKNIFRYLLTTRDRVYTKDDIIMYCRCYYGDRFNDVRVESGYEVGNEPKQGFLKVIKIILDGVSVKSPIDAGLLQNDILSGLKQRSPVDFEYRIIIQ